jgi:O-acetyl-ADP-ribose deacetylase (regulator of RNase III)
MSTVFSRIEIIKADITTIAADAIVNAANSSLLGGGGVDGAIHRAGGPAILEDCRKIIARQGGCKTGEAVITTAGNLPAKYVIHTVGPVWNGGRNDEEKKLAACYTNSLRIAIEYSCFTIVFPGISTGVYRFPKDKAAEIAAAAVSAFIAADERITKVIFACFDEEYFNQLRLQF